MVTFDKQSQEIDNIGTITATFYGLKADTKPTVGIGNGSSFIEMDTSKVFFFNAEAGEWLEVSGSGGGGSGGGGGMAVETTFHNDGYQQVYFKADKTAAEIIAAFKAGTSVVFHIPSDDTYGVYEGWFMLDGYSPLSAYNNNEMFTFLGQDSPDTLCGNIGNIETDNDGYIRFYVYID